MKVQFVEEDEPKIEQIFFLPTKDIKEEKGIQISSLVGQNNKQSNPTIPKTNNICPKCNRRIKIAQDKNMNKDEIIQWFTTFINRNEDNFTLDF